MKWIKSSCSYGHKHTYCNINLNITIQNHGIKQCFIALHWSVVVGSNHDSGIKTTITHDSRGKSVQLYRFKCEIYWILPKLAIFYSSADQHSRCPSYMYNTGIKYRGRVVGWGGGRVMGGRWSPLLHIFSPPIHWWQLRLTFWLLKECQQRRKKSQSSELVFNLMFAPQKLIHSFITFIFLGKW